MTNTWDEVTIEDFPLKGKDLVRFSDIDIVGHVNNLAFMSYLETGRVDLLYNMDMKVLTPGADFVLLKLNVLFRLEMKWPGEVDVGTAVTKMGNTSVTLVQALFQNGKVTGTADSTLVLIDTKTRKPTPLTEPVIEVLKGYAPKTPFPEA